MDGQQIFLFVLLGLASCSHDWISGSVSEMTFGAGDNITLYCDCKSSTGVYIVWYRNCSHVNQPSLVLKTMLQPDAWKHKTEADILNPLPRFHLVWNSSSESYDLQIMNITDLDEGLYYCGTEQSRLETLTPHYVYQYGNTTRILINTSVPHQHETPRDCGVCWRLLLSLCPASAVFSSLLSSLFVYHLCQKTGNYSTSLLSTHPFFFQFIVFTSMARIVSLLELIVFYPGLLLSYRGMGYTDDAVFIPAAKGPKASRERLDNRDQTRGNKDEDVCYAALEIRQASQRSKKKETQSSDVATYSAINTCQM
ncbi:uncharacterized protein LOC121180820 isoform X1 [Toxotes jaculatrix]|uniref:uncharacterized protein LOC121180820 isoform X1 n=1 Tax=Toxotes jaculatrix TaxID=941984 RepID=UPI001B3ABA87|nr:uncharacterized protein LOC121180820 isoform X1 [Toxotes jaculatrix]